MIVKKIYENSGDDSIVPIVKRGKIVDLVYNNSKRSICPSSHKIHQISEFISSNGNKSYVVLLVSRSDIYAKDEQICELFLGNNISAPQILYDVRSFNFNKDNDRLFIVTQPSNRLDLHIYNLHDLVLEDVRLVSSVGDKDGIACESNVVDVPIKFSSSTTTSVYNELFLLNSNVFENKKVERVFVFNGRGSMRDYPIIAQHKNGLFSIWHRNKWLSNIKYIYYYDSRLYLTNKNGKINVISCLSNGEILSPIWCDGMLSRSFSYGFESVVKDNGEVDTIGADFEYIVTEGVRDKIQNKYSAVFDSITNTAKNGDGLVTIFNDDKVIIYWHDRISRFLKKGVYDKIHVIHNVRTECGYGHDVFVCKFGDKIDLIDSISDGDIIKDFDGDVYSISDERGGCYLVTKEDNNDTYTVHFKNPIKNVTGARNIYDTMFVLRNSDGEFTLSSFYNSKFIMWAKKLYGEYDKYPVFVIDDNGKNKILIGVKYNNGSFEEICFPYIRKKWLDEIIDIDYENQSVEGKIGDDIVRYSLAID